MSGASRPALPSSIVRLEVVDSTSSELLRLLRGGAPEGTVVVARCQTAGRGQRGRSWHSPPDAGLYVSFSWNYGGAPAGLSFAAGSACARTLRDACGVDAGVRWPNDVVCRERKLGGVLIEQAGAGRMWIIGCGLNVNNHRFPPDLADVATSAQLETGRVFDLRAVERVFFQRMNEALGLLESGGFPAVLAEWRRLDRTAGRMVRVGERRLRASGVDGEGRLVAISGDRFEIIEAAGTLVWDVDAGCAGPPAAEGDSPV